MESTLFQALSDQYFILESAPHEWLFPRMSAVVHHGGMGTTAASIRAGVPTIIVPHNYDQPFWGEKVAKLGIGPKPIPRNKLSVENLSLAINTAISDQSMRNKAKYLLKSTCRRWCWIRNRFNQYLFIIADSRDFL